MTAAQDTANETSATRRLQAELFDIRDELNIYKRVDPEDNNGEITTTIDPDYLNQWNAEELQTKAKGRILSGPVRIIQYRVKEKDCKR